MAALIIVLISFCLPQAQAQEMTPEQLQQCADYLYNGGPWQWVGGLLTVVPMIYFALTKKNLPDIFRNAGKWVIEKAPKKEKSKG